jgi:hypothetical protein
MDGLFNTPASIASIPARTPEDIKRKEPEKPNSKIHSVIIWRVDPSRNDPRLPVFDGALKGGGAAGPFKVLATDPKSGGSQRSRDLDNRGRVVQVALGRWIR